MSSSFSVHPLDQGEMCERTVHSSLSPNQYLALDLASNSPEQIFIHICPEKIMTALLVLNCNSSPGCLMKEYACKRVYKHVIQTFFCTIHSFNSQMFHWVIYYTLGTVRGTGERDVNNPILIFTLYLARSNLTISLSYLKREREHFLSSILRVTIIPAKKKKSVSH